MALGAALAQPMEGELMPLHGQAVLPADGLVQVPVRMDVGQVQHGTAAVANEVAVGSQRAVEPLLSPHHAHALDQALLAEEDQLRYTVPRLRPG